MLTLQESTTKPRSVFKVKLKEIKNELKKAVNRLKGSASPTATSVLGHSKAANDQTQASSVGVAKPQILAYRLLGERTVSLLPLFKDVDINLQRSGMKVSFKGYVSLAILTTLVASFSVLIVVPLISLFVFRLAPLLILLYTAGVTLFAGAFSIIGFYLYPII